MFADMTSKTTVKSVVLENKNTSAYAIFCCFSEETCPFPKQEQRSGLGVETEGRVKEEKLRPGCKINEKKRKEKRERKNTSAAA